MASQENDPEGLRVEHIIAALDQIAALSNHVRTALAGVDPKTVIARRAARPGMGPGEQPLAGQCQPPEKE